jgi:hypothetical protein
MSVAGCARAEGVGLGERVARTAKQPQGPARRTPSRVAHVVNESLGRGLRRSATQQERAWSS